MASCLTKRFRFLKCPCHLPIFVLQFFLLLRTMTPRVFPENPKIFWISLANERRRRIQKSCQHFWQLFCNLLSVFLQANKFRRFAFFSYFSIPSRHRKGWNRKRVVLSPGEKRLNRNVSSVIENRNRTQKELKFNSKILPACLQWLRRNFCWKWKFQNSRMNSNHEEKMKNNTEVITFSKNQAAYSEREKKKPLA